LASSQRHFAPKIGTSSNAVSGFCGRLSDGRQDKDHRPCDCLRVGDEFLQRRSVELGLKVKIGCHTFRATGITAYREKRRHPRKRCRHGEPRLDPHYAADEVSLDEVARISI
jgi:hypothetical protein